DTLFTGDPEQFKTQVREWIDLFGVSSEDLKNLSLAALLTRLMSEAGNDEGTRSKLGSLLGAAQRFGLDGDPAGSVLKRLGV
ncbi:MAG: hypothetical protein KDM64_14525, partial [Verrucomicrobiae bacterium]|nr:hypothetical protein [Verrucomicrobiae bacterium]